MHGAFKMQIDRHASVIFGDASIIIRETYPGKMSWPDQKSWERQYRNEALKRMAQLMRKLGWTCEMPEVDPRDKERYGYGIAENSARNKRLCHKGDLRGEIDLSGCCLKLEMFQNVNAPNRPDHGGRYEFNKEVIMPYLLRLEMERTRRRIRDYLCNVFSGYFFDVEWMRKHEKEVGPGKLTSLERIQLYYEESSHFTGVDWEKYKSGPSMSHNLKSADGPDLEHGQQVWFADRKGRWQRGIAFYNINNMWWVITGPYSYTNMCCRELHTVRPDNLRLKANSAYRRKRLEEQMSAAVARMDFKRAEQLKNILFPPQESLYMIWTDRHGGAYFGPNYSGYTTDTNSAGKYTRSELKPYLGDADEKDHLRAVPVRKAA